MKNKIQDALKNLGLSVKEAEIYLFLGRKGPSKLGEITKRLKMNRGQVYRILKKLQDNNLVEATLESPTRFTAVPIEKIIDSTIKSKQEEILKIQNTKNHLISEWKKIEQSEIDSSLEKFSVIEGQKKIFEKIIQLIKETKKEIVSILEVKDLINADRSGVFENIVDHPLRDMIKFQFLTKVTKENLKAIETLDAKYNSSVLFKAKNRDMKSPIFPKVVIKDNNEIMLFISDEKDDIEKEAVLCTNCVSIIRSFKCMFEDEWQKSIEIGKEITEQRTGKLSTVMELIKDPEIARKKYFEALDSSRKEVLVITSSKGLVELSNNKARVEDLSKKGIIIKIMAPITLDNLDSMQQLLDISEVRHLPVGYFEMSLIDDQKLFQFNNSAMPQNDNSYLFNLENVLFTNDSKYIQRTKKSLFELWKKLHTPNESIQSIPLSHTSDVLHSSIKRTDRYGKKEIEYLPVNVTEDHILKKISAFRKSHPNNKSNIKWTNKLYFFGSRAFCLIQPADFLKLPNFVIGAFHNTKFSSFGEENCLRFFIKTEKEPRYQQIAIITDNLASVGYKKKTYKGMPGEKNIILVKKNQLKIIVRENTLFVGWTIPIKLIPEITILPPGCVLFETYGEVNSGVFNMIYPSERKQEVWYNNLAAFVTYFHPKLNYVGSGTEAFVDRNTIQISHPPNSEM